MASSTKAIMRSVVPSVDWCLEDDSLRAVPRCAWKAVQNLDVNLLSLSDTISSAMPFSYMMCFRKSMAVTSAVAVPHVGISHTLFEKRSTITNRASNSCLEEKGRCVTKSSA